MVNFGLFKTITFWTRNGVYLDIGSPSSVQATKLDWEASTPTALSTIMPTPEVVIAFFLVSSWADLLTSALRRLYI
jgi:hypothetical protein